jgi:hypothetical protein
MIGWGWLLASPWVAAAAIMSLVYSAGLAAWNEGDDLAGRFGARWTAYRRQVRNWLPRWRPYDPSADGTGVAPARLYVAESCETCSAVGHWIQCHHPTGLLVIAAEDHPIRDLTRITYDPGDGTGEEEGVAALGRALEHLHLVWAFLGWCLRLPLVCQLVQLTADAFGGGPRQVPRRPARTLTATTDPALAELWDNPRDAQYDRLS